MEHLYYDEKILGHLSNMGFMEYSNENEYVRHFLKLESITLTVYEKKLVFQSDSSKFSFNILDNINNLDYLYLDDKNNKKFIELKKQFETFADHNSLICDKCDGISNFLINLDIQNNEINFKFNDCNHIADVNTPFYMINNRILPDLSVLHSRILSKLIYLGFFRGFEIVIPTFILDVSDRLTKKEAKKGIQMEINLLKRYVNDGFIRIYSCPFENDIEEEAVLEHKEDNIILKLAHRTNSILFTQDKNLQSKSVVQNRPTIFYDTKYDKNIKQLINEKRVSD